MALVGAVPAVAQPGAAIVPVDWPRPAYPYIAQSARVEGEVEVAIDVRPDGSVAAVNIVRSVPLLDQAVIDAARRTRFECRGCANAVNRYSLTVLFRIPTSDDTSDPVALTLSPAQGRVTVVAAPVLITHSPSRPTTAAAQPDVAIVPIAWPKPVYPQIAQSARVEGEVEVAVDLRPDGSVVVVEVVRSVPLLDQAVTDAARRARFECRGCVDAVNRYSLYVTFKLTGRPDTPVDAVPPLVVSPTQGWVTVVQVPPTVEANDWSVVDRRRRGLKCLFLWRCEARARRPLSLAVAMRPVLPHHVSRPATLAI